MMQSMIHRRSMLGHAFRGVGGLALASMLYEDGVLAMPQEADQPKPHFLGKAKHCIFLFMWGGPSHIDLWDPKPELTRCHGGPIPES